MIAAASLALEQTRKATVLSGNILERAASMEPTRVRITRWIRAHVCGDKNDYYTCNFQKACPVVQQISKPSWAFSDNGQTHSRPNEKMASMAIFCFFDIFNLMRVNIGSPSKAKSENVLNRIGRATCQLAAAWHWPWTFGGEFGNFRCVRSQ